MARRRLNFYTRPAYPQRRFIVPPLKTPMAHPMACGPSCSTVHGMCFLLFVETAGSFTATGGKGFMDTGALWIVFLVALFLATFER
jgi:hypothetical protein